MNGKSMLLGLAPWVVFSVLVERIGEGAVGVAALLAFAGSLVLTAVGAREKGGIKVIDATGVVTFGVIALLGFFGPSTLDAPLADFGRGGSAFVLAMIMGVSVLTVPFTEQYARDTVDPKYWSSPVFRAKNKKISAMWAVAVFVMAICHVTAGALAAGSAFGGNPPGSALLNWVIPIALTVWVVKRTRVIVADNSGAVSERATR